jgi:hypothetical protein
MSAVSNVSDVTDSVENISEGELKRLAAMQLLHLQKDRERARQYYAKHTEARRRANLERYYRKKAQKRAEAGACK